MADPLFVGPHWSDIEESIRTSMERYIDQIDGNRLLNTSVDDLCDHIDEKYRIDVPILHEDQIVVDHQETPIDVSRDFDRSIVDRTHPFHVAGTLIKVTVPFSGDPQAFKIRTAIFTTVLPRANVTRHNLTIEIRGTDLQSHAVKAEIDKTLGEIRQCLVSLGNRVSLFNDQIRQIAHQRISRRRQKLLSDQDLVASLGFRLRERTDAPRTFTVPDVRRRVRPTMPAASTKPYRPEPALNYDDYEHILTVMSNMALVMERSPAAFSEMKEDDLRFHFLVQLNGHYEGQASGETFNYEGKTDILIRTDGKNIFIAECKYWSGAKNFSATIDQILGYLSWRDTKAAVIVFCRNKSFSRVLDTISDTIKEHENVKRQIWENGEGRFRYVFAHRDDRNREMILTVLAFHVPRIS